MVIPSQVKTVEVAKKTIYMKGKNSKRLAFSRLDWFFPYIGPYFHQLSPLGKDGQRVAMSVYLSVYLSASSQNTLFQRLWRLLVKDCFSNIGPGRQN